MTSRRQLEANRANAKRSTGPRTKSGKTRSRMNAVTHGLTAKTIVVGDEDPKQFERLLAGLEADVKPGSAIEQALVERLASALWRLGRVALFEAAVIRHEIEDLEEREQRRLTEELVRRAEFEELRREEHERKRRE
jgi:hypothetical protein